MNKLRLSSGRSSPEIKRFENYLPESFARLADLYLTGGERQKALEILEKYSEKYPEYPTGFWLLGKIYYQLGDKEKALGFLRRTLQIIPDHPAALRLTGKIYMENGEHAIARSYLKQVSQIDPLAEIEFKPEDESDKSDIRSKIKSPDKKGRDSAEPVGDEFATETMVRLYINQGHTNQARELCRQILVRQPENNRIKMILQELEN
jgi:tetratricopeptide (TPR) repeat protein